MINNRDFAKRLEKILEYFNLSASAFADEIGINRSTISHLVSGRNKPSLDFVMKVLEKFPEVDMDWLVLGKGSFPSTETNKDKVPKNIVKTVDLFSENAPVPQEKITAKNNDSKSVEKIVIFYRDGTFKSYEN